VAVVFGTSEVVVTCPLVDPVDRGAGVVVGCRGVDSRPPLGPGGTASIDTRSTDAQLAARLIASKMAYPATPRAIAKSAPSNHLLTVVDLSMGPHLLGCSRTWLRTARAVSTSTFPNWPTFIRRHVEMQPPPVSHASTRRSLLRAADFAQRSLQPWVGHWPLATRQSRAPRARVLVPKISGFRPYMAATTLGTRQATAVQWSLCCSSAWTTSTSHSASSTRR
jgi:hypothetical protein